MDRERDPLYKAKQESSGALHSTCFHGRNSKTNLCRHLCLCVHRSYCYKRSQKDPEKQNPSWQFQRMELENTHFLLYKSLHNV